MSDFRRVAPITRPPGFPQRSSWAIVASLFGCFVGAIALGTAVGELVQPGGQAAGVVVTVALLGVYLGGMALWGSIAASIMAKALFHGDVVKALLRFFLRRRREDLPTINLSPDHLLAAVMRVLEWSRVFIWLAAGVALIAAPVAGWFATRGFFGTALLTVIVVLGYGSVLRRLARSGYLIPPDVE